MLFLISIGANRGIVKKNHNFMLALISRSFKTRKCPGSRYLSSDFSSFWPKSIVEMIMPGQMPVAAAKANEIAGIYRSQCAVPKPVSHIPAHINELETTKKNLMALLILYLLIISSFYKVQ